MEYDLTEVASNIQNKDKVSISYIQRTFAFGFNKAHRIFNKLVEQGYINFDGKVSKNNVDSIKIIFLDVDGVLNCQSTKDLCGLYIGLEDKKVSLLKEIVDATNAKIVLVSSWKECWFKAKNLKDKQDDLATYLDNKLNSQGLSIWDKTNDNNSPRRGKGIIKYLEELKKNNTEVDNYIILDDELFDYLETKQTKHLIQTSYYQNGLERKHVRKAIERLC